VSVADTPVTQAILRTLAASVNVRPAYASDAHERIVDDRA